MEKAIALIYLENKNAINSILLEQINEIIKLDFVVNISFVALGKRIKKDLIKFCGKNNLRHSIILKNEFILRSVESARQNNVKQILRVFDTGNLIYSNTLMNLYAFYNERKKSHVIFKPGVNNNIKGKYTLADIINIDYLNNFEKGLSLPERIMYAMEKILKLFSIIILPLLKNQGINGIYLKYLGKKNVLLGKGLETREINEFGAYIGEKEEKERYLIDNIRNNIPFPMTVNVVVSNRCNLKCIMCPFHSDTFPRDSDYFDKPSFMPRKLFEKIAKEVGSVKGNIKIGNIEEPLLHKDIMHFVSFAKKSNVNNIHITTNGTLLDKQMSKGLILNGLNSIYISIDAATKETYNKIRGSDFNKINENMEYLIENRKKYGAQDKFKIFVSFIIQNRAKEEEILFLNKWLKLVDGVIMYNLGIVESGKDKTADYFFPVPKKRQCCDVAWTDVYILPGGEVSICCRTNLLLARKEGIISMGNVTNHSIKEVWYGDKFKTLRRGLLYENYTGITYCADCKLWASSIFEKKDEEKAEVYINPWTKMYYGKKRK